MGHDHAHTYATKIVDENVSSFLSEKFLFHLDSILVGEICRRNVLLPKNWIQKERKSHQSDLIRSRMFALFVCFSLEKRKEKKGYPIKFNVVQNIVRVITKLPIEFREDMYLHTPSFVEGDKKSVVVFVLF